MVLKKLTVTQLNLKSRNTTYSKNRFFQIYTCLFITPQNSKSKKHISIIDSIVQKHEQHVYKRFYTYFVVIVKLIQFIITSQIIIYTVHNMCFNYSIW